jgi:hypothetical protein
MFSSRSRTDPEGYDVRRAMCLCLCATELIHRKVSLIMKANEMHYFSNLFDKVC